MSLEKEQEKAEELKVTEAEETSSELTNLALEEVAGGAEDAKTVTVQGVRIWKKKPPQNKLIKHLN